MGSATGKKTAEKRVGEKAKQAPVEDKKAEGATKTGPTAAEKEAAKKAKEKERADAKKAKADEKADKVKKRNEERAAKKAEKDRIKAEKKKPHEGVIYHIATMLARKEGSSKKEALEHLVKTFPDRLEENMAVTLSIQITRLQKRFEMEFKKEKDEARGGLVYKAPAALPGLVLKGSVRGGAKAE